MVFYALLRVFSFQRLSASSGRASGAAAGLPDSMRILCACSFLRAGCGSCARLLVCRFVSVSGSGCPAGFAFPVCICSGSIALHCVIVLVTHCKILRFKRIRLLYIHFRVYAFKMDSGRVLCGSRAFRAVPVPVLRVLIGLRSIICRF